MATSDFIAVIELGSSKIVGLAGRKKEDGVMEILAYAKEDASTCIQRGIIYNIDKVANALTSIIGKMESQLDCLIGKVYVSTGGQSLQSRLNKITRDMDSDIIIDQSIIDAVSDENLNLKLPQDNYEILDVIPQEYVAGNSEQIDPKGVICKQFTGKFLNIIARDTLRTRIEQGFEKAKIDIAHIYISPLITSDAILTEKDIRAGCAMIDLGAETTTIAIFRNRILRYLVVLPLGSNSITRDIATCLKIEDDEAEYLKQTYGDVMYKEADDKDPVTFMQRDNQIVKNQLLNNIILARATEIVENVWSLIKHSNYADNLYAGFVLTGGGANLRNLDKLFEEKCKIDKIRFAKKTTYSFIKKDDMPKADGMYNTVAGVLFQGKEDCLKVVEIPEPEPVIEKEPEPVIMIEKPVVEETIVIEQVAEPEPEPVVEEKPEKKKPVKETKEHTGPKKPSPWTVFTSKLGELFSEDDNPT